MKLLLFVLFCAAAYFAGHYAIRQYEKEAEAKRSHWPRQIAELMENHVARHAVAALSAEEGDATFYQILYQSHTAKEEVTDLGAMLREAATIAGATANEAGAIATSIEQNLAMARQLGVFEDITNLLRMERGEPPIAKAAGWEGEPLAIGHLIPPVLVPSLVRSLPNMVLEPQIVRDFQGDEITPEMLPTVRQFQGNRLIAPETAAALSAKANAPAR
ncbi:MAG: hypothetical protein KDK97_12550 [Verrucomicrobiales bacterium]|nr:hypothetical protein [Verrucomicrobiales bacterium]